MEFWVMPIRRYVVIDRLSYEFLNSIWVIERLAIVSAPMKFGEPNIGDPFYRFELGCVMNPSSFVQFDAEVLEVCKCWVLDCELHQRWNLLTSRIFD